MLGRPAAQALGAMCRLLLAAASCGAQGFSSFGVGSELNSWRMGLAALGHVGSS